MVSESIIRSAVAILLAAAPLRAVEFPALPLQRLSEPALREAAAAVVKEKSWEPWSAWLAKVLGEELSRPTLKPDAAKMKAIVERPGVALALAQWRLVSVTGAAGLNEVLEGEGGAEFLTWLLSTPAALHAYLGSGPLDKEGTGRGLAIWRDIFRSDPASRDGLWLRVAAATALAHTEPVKSLADGGEIDPLKRYQRFRTAHGSGQLASGFDGSAVWELRYVVNSWARDEELAWVLEAMDPKHRTQAKIGEACWMVPYRLHNSKGVSVQNGPEYYDHRPVTLQLMHEVGGVCGAISKFGTAAAQAYGVAAMPVGQPGHCAFLWKEDATTWRTGNDIEGWAGSSQHGGIRIHWGTRGSYVLLMEEAHRDPAAFLASEQTSWTVSLGGANALPLAEAAVRLRPSNGGAWQVRMKTAEAADAPRPVWQSMARELMQTLKDHPLPMVDFLAKVEPRLDFGDVTKRRQYVAAAAAAMTSGDAKAQRGCGQAAQAELVRRHAGAVVKGGLKAVDRALAKDDDGADAALTPAENAAVLSLVEAAVESSRGRGDLQDALTGRWLGLMSADPASLARAIKFFGGLFETARQNPDRKPAIALARRLILLAAQAEDLASMEKYSVACQALVKGEAQR